MSTPPSKVRLLNKALTLLGTAGRILTIDDDRPEARAMAALYDEARDATLADHPWNFAIRRAVLAADATPPAFGYARSFALPAQCLRWLPWPEGHDYWFAGEQEGAALLSDADAPLYVRYIVQIEDIGLWSPGARQALAWRLAAEAGESLSADAIVIARMWKSYEKELARGKRQDGLATGSRDDDDSIDSAFLAARRHG